MFDPEKMSVAGEANFNTANVIMSAMLRGALLQNHDGCMGYYNSVGIYEMLSYHNMNEESLMLALASVWAQGVNPDASPDGLAIGMFWGLKTGEVQQPAIGALGNVVFDTAGALVLLLIHNETQQVSQLIYPVNPEIRDSWEEDIEPFAEVSDQSSTVRLLRGAILEVKNRKSAAGADGADGMWPAATG